ncbi:MAG: hypothetical protein ACRC68_06710 [Clostridium sp.]
MINYKVIKIIDEYRIVVNVGANEGIKSGDIFEIFVQGEMVIDIDSKEELGTLDFIKAKIEVETVFEKMCICVNELKVNNSPFATAGKLALSFYGNSEKEPETLNITMSEITGGLSNYDKKIKLGDLVRETLG